MARSNSKKVRRESSALRAFFAAVGALWLAAATPPAACATPVQKPPRDPITSQLEQRLKTDGSLDDVVADIRWPLEKTHVVCRVYGNGVGIWDRRVQFRMSQQEIASLFQAVVRARFGALPNTLGGRENEKKRQKGQMIISIGSATKTVVQLEGGDQSATLQSLADRFLKASRRSAAQGVSISSFADGFERLAAGTLAPEVFAVVFQRKTRAPGKRTYDSWTLRLDGQRATVRAMRGAEIQGTTRELTLSKADFDALLRLLRDSALGTLPRNLYSAQDTDVRIQVLDQVCAVKAGPSPGLTSTTHGASQRSFDRILAALLALYGRVEKEGGQPSRGTTPRPAPHG